MPAAQPLAISLAQASLPKASSGAILWAVILIVVVMILGAALMVLRRKLFAPDDEASEAGLLETLRAMNRRGELSDEEFEAARRNMQASIRRRVEQRAAELEASRPKTGRSTDNSRRTPAKPHARGNRGKMGDGSGGPTA
ncbi:MAG: hypothetical protein K2Q20_00505 [Phycisphaerales bacterium]|nr:hypothetical protein [Phycisphaerales bacterium]